jgi:hypothetical protein
MIARGAGDRRAQEGEGVAGDLVEIGKESAGGAQGGAVEGAEAVERGHAETLAQALLGGDRIEAAPPLLVDHFRRRQAGELGVEGVGRDRAQFEAAGRDVGGGEAAKPADPRHCHQPVGRARIEQGLLGERAGGDDADDGAVDHRLGTSLPRLGRALDLLGDGDPEAALDQPRQIGFGGVNRHPAHRDRLALMLAPRGQRDVEARRRRLGVVEEQFEEVAHPVEKQAIARLRLEREILRHHRRRGAAALRLGGHAERLEGWKARGNGIR